MENGKKEFLKAEAEIVVFDKNDDIVTLSGTGQNPINPPSDNPPIPW